MMPFLRARIAAASEAELDVPLRGRRGHPVRRDAAVEDLRRKRDGPRRHRLNVLIPIIVLTEGHPFNEKVGDDALGRLARRAASSSRFESSICPSTVWSLQRAAVKNSTLSLLAVDTRAHARPDLLLRRLLWS